MALTSYMYSSQLWINCNLLRIWLLKRIYRLTAVFFRVFSIDFIPKLPNRDANWNFVWGGVNTLWTDCSVKIFLDRLSSTKHNFSWTEFLLINNILDRFRNYWGVSQQGPAVFSVILHCVKMRKGDTINFRFGGRSRTFCNSARTTRKTTLLFFM